MGHGGGVRYTYMYKYTHEVFLMWRNVTYWQTLDYDYNYGG